MKITIDTNIDSKDDIKKTIEFLNSLISDKMDNIRSDNNIDSSQTPVFDLFDEPEKDNSKTNTSEKEVSDKPKVEIIDW